MYAKFFPSGDQAGTPATGALESRLKLGSFRARRNRPSSLPQATELSTGDHTGIPEGSPTHVSPPFSMPTAKTPSWALAATHPLIVKAAKERITNSHISGEKRGLDLFIILPGRPGPLPDSQPGRTSQVRSIPVACSPSTQACAYHGEVRQLG